MIQTLLDRAGDQGFVLSATRIAEGLFGSNVAANRLLVGYAWQKGLLPLTAAAVEAAIEANGAAIALNKRAFAWGRMAAFDLPQVEQIAGITANEEAQESIDALIARRAEDLVAYQDAAYAARYRTLLERVRFAVAPFPAQSEELLRAVAINAYKLWRIRTNMRSRAFIPNQLSGNRWMRNSAVLGVSRSGSRRPCSHGETGAPAVRSSADLAPGYSRRLAGLRV
jgi:hypothetical protein